jgi:peptidyl-prolyl cis-trans isomerase B (cyclophilin B)
LIPSIFENYNLQHVRKGFIILFFVLKWRWYSHPISRKSTLQLFFLIDMTKAEMITDKGTMIIEFYDEDAPNTVKNFVDLAKKGFYDGVIFHRVIPDFVIQGGDPTGTGRGGPGYQIKCELSGGNQYHDRGVLSMAHAGRDTGGSQFFICHSRNNTAHLDRNHTCFGKVVEGVETVDLIQQGDKIQKITILEEVA